MQVFVFLERSRDVPSTHPSDSALTRSFLCFEQPDQISVGFYSSLVEFSDVAGANFPHILLGQTVGPVQILEASFDVFELSGNSRKILEVHNCLCAAPHSVGKLAVHVFFQF